MDIAGSGTPEGIALAMTWHIMDLEKELPVAAERQADPRRYMLALYGECLAATRGKKPKGE